MDGTKLRDVRPLWSIGLPVGCFIACLAAAIANPEFYKMHVRRHETGVIEQATVISLVPAAVMGVLAIRRRGALPRRWLAAWCLVITAGAVYFAGEECSWGQNYFRWATPEQWSQFNDQNETNLHNTSGLFDHLPRALLSVAAAACAVVPLVLGRRLGRRDPRKNWWVWILPTTAVVPAAAMAILIGLPQRIHSTYDKHVVEQTWYSEMLFAGRHSELKELLLALFILMYLWSFATRLRSIAEPRELSHASVESPSGGRVAPSANPAQANSAAA